MSALPYAHLQAFLAVARTRDRNWELLAPFEGLRIQTPALFVTGDADPGYETLRARLPALPEVLAQLAGTLVLPGGGHWLGEERPDEVNAAILGFLAGLVRTA